MKIYLKWVVEVFGGGTSGTLLDRDPLGKYRLRARAGWYSVLIGESNVAIVPALAIGGYGVEDIYIR